MSAEPLPDLAPSYAGRSSLELLFTAPDEETQRSLTLLCIAVVEGATILRSTAEPWQVRISRGRLDDAAWRERVKNLVEAY